MMEHTAHFCLVFYTHFAPCDARLELELEPVLGTVYRPVTIVKSIANMAAAALGIVQHKCRDQMR